MLVPRLLSFGLDGRPTAGLLIDGRVHDAGVALGGGATTVMSLLEDWPAIRDLLPTAAARAVAVGDGVPLDEVVLLPPIGAPATVYGAGANYADHAEEMARLHDLRRPTPGPAGASPWFFVKGTRSLVGHGHPVEVPDASAKLDWEAELAVVIGRRAKAIGPEDAPAHVAAYTIANDLSARGRSRSAGVPDGSVFRADWVGHKCFDGSCPIGPWLTPSGAVGDPMRLVIRTTVNGAVKQDSTTAHMIHDVAAQMAHLSQRVTLWPGDVILTGTPAGVGAARGEFLQPGDVVSVEIEQLGRLTTPLT